LDDSLSIFNTVITLSVISVANSCTFGSTRTLQALAERGMSPKIFAYVDKKGRLVYAVILQILFGLLAFIGESAQEGTVFTWLLSLSGLSYFSVWGSICLCHIRFRKAWVLQGRSTSDLPYRTPFGVVGSYVGLSLNILCLIATFYVSVWVCCLGPFASQPILTCLLSATWILPQRQLLLPAVPRRPSYLSAIPFLEGFDQAMAHVGAFKGH
jgi:amino acid transporter